MTGLDKISIIQIIQDKTGNTNNIIISGEKRIMKFIHKINYKKVDYIMLLSMTLLIGVGLYCIKQAYLFSEDQDESYTKQLLGVGIGFVMVLVILFIDYHFICKLSPLLYVGMIGVLVLTLLIGGDLNNVKRWIKVFGITIQPSEFSKVILILFLAFLLNYFRERLDKLYLLFILGAVVAIPMILIIMEPHLSSCISILFIFCMIVYSSGISYKLIGAALAICLPIILGIIISVTQFNVDLPFIQEYQINRVLSFQSTDESEDLKGKFQQNQAIEAIKAGGIRGKLITGEDTEREYHMIYAKESDFIFSIVGEEFGFIGSCLIILLYSILIAKCLLHAAHAPDNTGKLICIGVSSLLMFQTFVNIGVATSLLPNTGLPLPFISNGLTSLISSMAAVGLVMNVGLRKEEKENVKTGLLLRSNL